MTKMEKAVICDNILRRFVGNRTIHWEDLREEYKGDMHNYHVTENNINYLIADGMIKRNNGLASLSLTEKGFATLADIDVLGYVAQETDRARETKKNDRRIRIDRRIQIAILFISLAALIVALIALRGCH